MTICVDRSVFVNVDNYAWDPDYMGSSMMVPVLYVTWFMAVVFVSLMGELRSHKRLCSCHVSIEIVCVGKC